MEIENLINEILETQDINRLYQLQIECNQDMAILQRRKTMAETNLDQSDAIGNIKVLQSAIDVCGNRISDLKEQNAQDRVRNAKFNYNFYLAAKIMLKRDTMNSITTQANKQAWQIRENKEELTSKKLE